MKPHICALTLALCATPAWVAAHDDGPDAGRTRTRAQAELEQAWRDGLLPHSDKDYPPTPASIERNRKRYAIAHPQAGAAPGAAQTDASAESGK